MKRMILLMIVALITISAAGLMNQYCEPVRAEEETEGNEGMVMEIVIPTPEPTPTPAVDFDLRHLSITCSLEEANDKSGIYDASRSSVECTPGSDEQALYDTKGQEDDQADSESQSGEVQQDPEEQLTYLGNWTITAYCPCEECCGPWASGYTASGAPAVAGHTVACNILPTGSRILIDGVEYTVEDTGWSPYGDEWIDIFFYTHEEALNFGIKEMEVYLIEKGE